MTENSELEEGIVPGWNDSPVSGDRVDVHMGPLVAGTPGGARVEVTGDGLHAYDATGAETARIQGEGGEFVGGSFRTSDALPGQVTMSDTAHQGRPGVAVEPDDSADYDVLPSVGPGPGHMHISGGVGADGSMSGAQFSAGGTRIYHNSPGATGSGSWALVNGGEARLAYRPDRTDLDQESGVWVRPHTATIFSEDESGVGTVSASGAGARVEHVPVAGSGDRASRISADADSAMVSMTATDGTERRLRIDPAGAWVEIETGPHTNAFVSHNLLSLIDKVADLEARVAALEV